ncbi:MAG: AAA family ATPase [archaeon]
MNFELLNIQKGINLIYGEPATGKTTLAMQLALDNVDKGKIIFIDTERGFSVERIKQIDKNYEDKLNKICVINVNNFKEQGKCVENLLKIKNIRLVVIDSLGFYYRLKLKKDPNKANKDLDKQFQVLSDISKYSYVLILNQVYQNIDTKKVEVVGGNMVKNWSKSILRLEKNPRKIIFEKPYNKEIRFKIDDSGIVVL